MFRVTHVREVSYEDYAVVKYNGQLWVGPLYKMDPISESQLKEIFISNIHPLMPERELFDFLAQAGTIYFLRIMKDVHEKNRGFCYIKYFTTSAYINALQILPHQKVSGRYLRFAESRDFNALVLHGIDANVDTPFILSIVRGQLIVKDIKVDLNNRVHTFVFYNHRETALARRYLLTLLPLFGRKSYIRWAKV